MGKWGRKVYKILVIIFWVLLIDKVFSTRGINLPVFLILVISVILGIISFLLLDAAENKVRRIEVENSYKLDLRFMALYEELKLKYARELDSLRRSTIRFGFLAIVVLICYIFNRTNEYLGMVILIVDILLIIVMIVKYKNFIDIYKNDVISGFVKLIDEKLHFTRAYDVKSVEDDFIYSNFEKEFSSITTDDCITKEGEDGVVDFRLNDIIVKNVVQLTDGNVVEENLFAGCFVSVNNMVETDMLIRIVKNKKKLFNDSDYNVVNNKIKMDNTEFEEYFDIYADDKIEAMRILTPDVMDDLVEFSKTGLKFEITINNDKLYLRFFTGKMFEPPSIFESTMNISLLYTYYCVLTFVYEITTKLNNSLKEYIP